MESEIESKKAFPLPVVEIHVGRRGVSAAAGGVESRLSQDQISAIQSTLADLVAGFHPPKKHSESDSLQLNSMEIELGFKLETSSGSALKLLFDATAEASITAKLVWTRPE